MRAAESSASARSADAPPSEITLERLLAALARSWRWIFAGAVLGAVLAVAFALSQTPIYRAVVVVAPVSAQDAGGALSRLAGQFGGLASLAGVDVPGSGKRDEAIAVLRSRAFGEAIIRETGLMQVLFRSRWDPERKAWTPDWRGRVPTIEDAWRAFDLRVRSIVEDRDRGLISVRVELADRELTARLANLIVQRANEELRARRLGELDRSLGFLEKELSNARLLGLEQAISRVMESQINERMLASVRDEFAFRVIDPAVASDPDRYVRPSRPLYAAFGFVFGALFGFAFAAWRRPRR